MSARALKEIHDSLCARVRRVDLGEGALVAYARGDGFVLEALPRGRVLARDRKQLDEVIEALMELREVAIEEDEVERTFIERGRGHA